MLNRSASDGHRIKNMLRKYYAAGQVIELDDAVNVSAQEDIIDNDTKDACQIKLSLYLQE